jgi:aspartate/methionine/tyrosine aminotransferase
MLSVSDLNPRAVRAEYAVRGPIVLRAQQLEAEGRPIVYCNIGNPQELGQKPVSFVRQLLSLVEYPELLSHPALRERYPADVVERARMILRRHPAGTGAYTQSAGIPFIREAVAGAIAARDGIPASKDTIILTDGASKGVHLVLTALLGSDRDGIMIPIPQYPLYSATITLFGGRQIGYYLDENSGWQVDERALAESLSVATAEGIRARGIVVINPGNPTGGVLSETSIRMIIGFARRHGLAVIADEVYQENIYFAGSRFLSFARVMADLGETSVPLFSLNSISKGFLGECGHRGGYLEIRNVEPQVLAQFVKLQSIQLCANAPGQIATYAMVAPPREGDASHAVWVAERRAILDSLKRKAEILAEAVNRIEGLSVVTPLGAMYAFVRLNLPPDNDLDSPDLTPAARLARGEERDARYCMALLEETGICVVPGSGFGQRPGTLHFRTTFLPPLERIEELADRLRVFHESYVKELERAHHA